MAIKVYGTVDSTRTQRVLLILLELQLSYELIEVSLMSGGHKDAAYVQKYHPFGRVPALEDGSFRLFESRAICRYLVERYGTKSSNLDVSIGTAEQTAIFEQAASVEVSYFEPPIVGLSYEMLFKKMMGHGDANVKAIEIFRADVKECLDYYDNILSHHEYLAGNDLTLVDLFHAPWINFLPRLGMENEVTSRPNLRSWWDRISQRISWHALDKLLH